MKEEQTFMVSTIAILLALFGNALGDCELMREAMKKRGNDAVPQNILEKTVGEMTFVYMSKLFFGSTAFEDVECYAESLAGSIRKTRKEFTFLKSKNPIKSEYFVSENNGEIQSQTKKTRFDTSTEILGTRTIITFNNNVYLFFECRKGDPDHIVGIGVMKGNVEEDQVKEEIGFVKRFLRILGMDTGVDMSPCPPEKMGSLDESYQKALQTYQSSQFTSRYTIIFLPNAGSWRSPAYFNVPVYYRNRQSQSVRYKIPVNVVQ